jgi:Flp pilus assembly protein TadG
MFKKETEKGQALILILLGIFGIISLAALAVDGGNAFADRRQAQSAADTAALAAALARINNQNWQAAGTARATENGYPANGPQSTVTVVSPPTEGKYSCAQINNTPPAGDSCNEYVQVIIDSSVDTWFAPLVGVDTVNNRVTAVARAKPAITEPMFFGHAMVSLNKKECRAFTINGSSTTTITSDTGAGLFINSDCHNGGPQSAFAVGSSVVAPSITIAKPGQFYVQNPSDLNGTTPGGGTQISDIKITWPQPTCTGEAEETGHKTGIMSPGNYDDNSPFPPNGIKILNPGIYCINDANVSINSDLTGEGVLLYVKEGSITMNGSANIRLSAPASGQYAGLLFYQPIDNDEGITINGSNQSAWTGMILSPGSNCKLNGSGAPDGLNSQIICDTIDVSGSAAVKIHYSDSQNYDGTVPPQIELTQ